MVSMDIFRQDAFSMVSMVGAVERIEYIPQFLGGLNVFERVSITTDRPEIERRNGSFDLLQTSERGAPMPQIDADKRDIRVAKTRRIAEADRLSASEIFNLRAFGSETETVAMQTEVARRLARLQNSIELTREYHRLGAVQGVVLDADGTILDDWFKFWEVPRPAPLNLALTKRETDVRTVISNIERDVSTASGGAWVPGTKLHALAGDEFFDRLVQHPSVRELYLGWAAAAGLNSNLAFSDFTFGGITWHNYRGADSFSALATKGKDSFGIKPTEAALFPVGVRGMFQEILAPGEGFSEVQGPGRPIYAKTLPDPSGDDAFVSIKVATFPLYACTRPELLRRVTM